MIYVKWMPVTIKPYFVFQLLKCFNLIYSELFQNKRYALKKIGLRCK